MKIVRIFAEKLFAFKYQNEADNELRRLLTLWNDTTTFIPICNQIQG